MQADELAKTLRPLRKPLVQAAEKVIYEANDEDFGKLNKTQLPHLINICSAAACPEEIDNFLRYQCARHRGPWPKNMALDTIEGIKPLLEHLDDDVAKVAAWKLYATYMSRAYTYRSKAGSEQSRSHDQGAGRASFRGGNGQRDRRPQGEQR